MHRGMIRPPIHAALIQTGHEPDGLMILVFGTQDNPCSFVSICVLLCSEYPRTAHQRDQFALSADVSGRT